MDTSASDCLYTIHEIASGGRGLFAATTIPKGTRILSEPPLFKAPRGGDLKRVRGIVSQAVTNLTDEQQQRFLSLHNSFEEDGPYLGRARTNALPLGSDATEVGLFLHASRINHSCIQNAQHTWNENIQELTIHSVRDIAEGEEITIFYLTHRQNRSARREALQTGFCFTCFCTLCSLPDDAREKSDKRCDEILKLDEEIGDGMGIIAAPLQTLHNVHKLLDLLEEEGVADATVPRAYYDAFQIAITHSDMARAKVFAERAAAARIVLEGKDSHTVQKMEDYAEDPSRHLAYGCTRKWRSSSDSVPNELDKAAFERWLWRNEGPKSLQYADLRNEVSFPSFGDLPEENDIDLTYFDTANGFYYQPTRHWCFLGEIVSFEIFFRLRLIVKDKSGHKIPIAFHTDSAGVELNPACLRQGHTVAILYAEQHGFLDFSIGIRHENPSHIKIFPLPLDTLLELSDKIQKYSKKYDGGLRMCQGCSKKAPSLQKCARCGMFWYCDKHCQVSGWNKMGHKGDCARLKDPDLKNLFCQNWDVFDDYFQYPLLESSGEE